MAVCADTLTYPKIPLHILRVVYAGGLFMEKFDLYKDMQLRTGGEIYAGIVGPVRTGKSTFARKFVESLVLPELTDAQRNMTRDAMPSSASGRTVTTVEPKFIPREAVSLAVGDGTDMKVRIVDCVGFLVPGAEGVEENGHPRLVQTPWQEQPVPFSEAARMGTQKVIREHATIALIVTTDGSFGELPRAAFLDAERETITELQRIGKPFLVIVNSARPSGEEAKATAAYLQQTYGIAPVILNCEQMDKNDLYRVFEQFLLEFPLTRVAFQIPKWVEMLEDTHWLKKELFEVAKQAMQKWNTVRDLAGGDLELSSQYIKRTKLEQMDFSTGSAEVIIWMQEPLYYQVLSEMTGTKIESEYQLISIVREMAKRKKEYDTVSTAVEAVRQTGYGVIAPQKEEIRMEEPQVMKQGSRYGVKIRATSPSVHLIRADIETEIAPIVGSEQQAKDLIEYMKQNEQEDGMWNTLIFGKSVEQMIEEGIQSRLSAIGEESQLKLQDTMKRIVNESKGRIICIIL